MNEDLMVGVRKGNIGQVAPSAWPPASPPVLLLPLVRKARVLCTSHHLSSWCLFLLPDPSLPLVICPLNLLQCGQCLSLSPVILRGWQCPELNCRWCPHQMPYQEIDALPSRNCQPRDRFEQNHMQRVFQSCHRSVDQKVLLVQTVKSLRLRVRTECPLGQHCV